MKKKTTEQIYRSTRDCSQSICIDTLVMAEYALLRPVFDIIPARCQRLLLLNNIAPAPESPYEKINI